MFLHEFRGYLHLGIPSEQNEQPHPSHPGDCKKSVYCPDYILAEKYRHDHHQKLCCIGIETILENAVSPVVEKVDIFDKAHRTAEKDIKKEQVQERNVARLIEHREMAFKGVAENKNQHAEEAQEQESIEQLRGFLIAALSHPPVGFVTVIQGKQDWMMPVTQKKVINPAMNMNISNSPISARVSFFVNTMLIIRKITGFISWNSWSPEILSISLIFLNPCRIIDFP
jgi:hypothetical protein